MTPEQLAAAIREALEAAIDAGELALESAALPEVRVERPRQREHGDWATNVAMQLGKKAGTTPRALAELLAGRLGDVPGIAGVEIAGPGFLNIRLDSAAAGALAKDIVEAGESYGRTQALAGHHINLEFVSANPTGPIHIGGVRWAAVGDSLARVLEATGAVVTREYYFNDHGAQIDRFVRSLIARARREEPPEDGYAGEYITEIANRVLEARAAGGAQDPRLLPSDEEAEVFRSLGVGFMFEEIRQKLSEFG
nr:arginine--tRNA ligase [Actinomycetales bacterium]